MVISMGSRIVHRFRRRDFRRLQSFESHVAGDRLLRADTALFRNVRLYPWQPAAIPTVGPCPNPRTHGSSFTPHHYENTLSLPAAGRSVDVLRHRLQPAAGRRHLHPDELKKSGFLDARTAGKQVRMAIEQQQPLPVLGGKNFSHDTRCSSCRAREAAFGCEAVVKSVIAVCLAGRVSSNHGCYAAERSLAGSAAATDHTTA
ncbi:hypothetical protein ABIA48_001013 [Pseudomonas sp. S30_BP2TU TE3576]